MINMINMQIPEIIYMDILTNYNNIHDNYLISKSIENKRNIKINRAISIINRYIYKYISDFRIAMDINHYCIPKIYYKRFYPLKERRQLILLALEVTHNENYEYQKKLYEEILIKPNHLVINFNKVIDSLSHDDLMLIGWELY